MISDQRLIVIRDDAKVVNLTRGVDRQSYSCTPRCNPSLTVGDDTKFFETVAKSGERKIKFSEGAAEAAGGGGGQ